MLQMFFDSGEGDITLRSDRFSWSSCTEYDQLIVLPICTKYIPPTLMQVIKRITPATSTSLVLPPTVSIVP